METTQMTALEIRDAVRTRKISAVEVTQQHLLRISTFDESIGSFLLVDADGALAQAKKVDEAISQGQGETLTLAGVPVGIKDMIVTEGLETTAGSKILKGFIPPYDATVVTRLKQAGAIILGKLNMDEFAMGSSNENSAYKSCHNPWDLQRVPGGSSGGSAAAVAADFCPLTLGTDTGGSIRQPAALCGVAGIKPTYGRVSRYGAISFASSLDQIGPLARTATDLALALEAMGGHDRHDSTSINTPFTGLLEACSQEIKKGLRIGIPQEYFGAGLDERVAHLVKDAIRTLESLGATVVNVSLPLTEYSIAAYYLVATAEASSNLGRYDGVRYGYRATDPTLNLIDMYEKTRSEGFGPEVKRRLMLGACVLRSGYAEDSYKRASQVRTLIRADFARVFEECDIIITPTSPVPAFRIGERLQDPMAMYLADVYTTSCNLAGLPGLSVPCGFVNESGKNLPVGLQILGAPLADAQILQVAAAYQRVTEFHNHHAIAPVGEGSR